MRDQPGRTPPRANPDGRDTSGSFFVPSLPASLLKFPISASLMTVLTTNRTGDLAASLMPSHAFFTTSLRVVNASPTSSVARPNRGAIVSRNQLATGAITLSRTKFHAVLMASRIVLNAVLIRSTAPSMIERAVSLIHETTVLMVFLTNSHASLSESRIVLNAFLIHSITRCTAGHAT